MVLLSRSFASSSEASACRTPNWVDSSWRVATSTSVSASSSSCRATNSESRLKRSLSRWKSLMTRSRVASC